MQHLLDDQSCVMYLIRHGATPPNELRPYTLQGSGINPSLSETGWKQARAVGEFLRSRRIDAIYSSPMQRACETAGAIARHHELPVTPLPGIQECHVGKWEGLDWGSIQAKYPEEYQQFQLNPAEIPYLGGESYGDVFRRAAPILSGLFPKHLGQVVAVVAHNVVNRVYLANLLGMELRRAKSIPQNNTCINVLRYHQGETELVSLNACFHLSAD